jgi:hypothetical protein
MDRRFFLGSLGAFGSLLAQPTEAAPAATGGKTRFYALEQLFLKNGTQAGRLNEFYSKSFLPALNRYHSGPKIVLDALIAPHMPQMAVIMGFESLDQMWTSLSKVSADADLLKAMDVLENNAEPPFESQTNSLLEAVPYSPEIAPLAEPPASPRIFELRVYHSPTVKQLRALHQRFENSEVKLFHRSGIHPVLYTSTVFGANMPNLTYLIPFENLAAREKAWAAFAADPEWVKVRQESVEKFGQISSISNMSLYKATAYSPIR